MVLGIPTFGVEPDNDIKAALAGVVLQVSIQKLIFHRTKQFWIPTAFDFYDRRERFELLSSRLSNSIDMNIGFLSTMDLHFPVGDNPSPT